MTRIELIHFIEKAARDYKNGGVLKSIRRSRHMNNFKGKTLPNDAIDAILVDFINFIAMRWGIDYGLKTTDLTGIQKKSRKKKFISKHFDLRGYL